MKSKDRGALDRPQLSSMENFLDEYQFLRLVMSLGGLGLMLIQLSLGAWDDSVVPIAVVLLLSATHATWCWLRKVRAPKSMLALDLTLWGWVMTLIPELPAITTASLAFLVLLTVLFADGFWSLVFIPYIASWYGLSFFSAAGFSTEALNVYASVVFTVTGLALVMWRIKTWLGRLDANRSQMLGTVSHELRNNLTGMIGMTEVIQSQDLDVDEIRELMSLAHMQAVDASEIVEDLLTASRLERATLSVDLLAVDINAEVCTTVRRFAGEGMEIAVEFAENLPAASADGLRVRQILRNLLSNAARYGGSSVTVRTLIDDDQLRVVVSDDGDGVPSEDEGTIFLPYRRSTTTNRHASSIGLGLWICRQLAVAMGGTLEYRRADGATEFVLSLESHHDAATSDHPVASELNPIAAVGAGMSAMRERLWSGDVDYIALATWR